MSADNTGGVAVWIWVLAGIAVGLFGGWWYGDFASYTLLCGLLGWFTGLSLDTMGGDDAH